MLYKNNRIVIPYGMEQQSFCVIGIGGNQDPHARNICQDSFQGLGMLRAVSQSGSALGPNHHGNTHISTIHITQLRHLIQDLIKAYSDKINIR